MSEVAAFKVDEVAPKGTIQRKVYDHLLSESPGTEVGALAASQVAGLDDSAGINKYMTGLVSAGLLAQRKQGNRLFWRLSNTTAKGQRQAPDDDGGPLVRRAPAALAPSVFAFAQSRGAAAFAVFVGTDGRMKVERHGKLVVEFTDAERRQLIVAAAQGVVPR